MGVERHGFTPIGTVTDERGGSRMSRMIRNFPSGVVRVIRDTFQFVSIRDRRTEASRMGVERHGFTPIGTVTDERGRSRMSRMIGNFPSVLSV